ncbi:FAD-binding domain-containing protein [Lutimonas halocynthiae]|uniref:FAD-binding domain-containing protein n=1 Tax=Lutimonas halocynthiae TaxID=1446477 RepID=UPI0025B3220B|nr:FAD-binding domain-containing protein [Lutimonas halocynthiae]MDN3643760.1 FAD-binding domain-containing protein [Lutimonas halocynthiae]
MLFENDMEMFPTSYKEILQRIDQIDPVKYSNTRNYLNGAVSYLSPYISRGVISTKFVFTQLIERGFHADRIEKFIQELAWRDYWQQVWIHKGDAINTDLKNIQNPVTNVSISKGIIDANTGVDAIDKAILSFYKTGYMHNHMRMYVASIACNVAQSHWNVPAKWMYYHLLDADWASNALSWQWVAGANSQKKYYANQENINKYCFTNQKDTYLDTSYGAFADMDIPDYLSETVDLVLETSLPPKQHIVIDESVPTCIYNFYNLDPNWQKAKEVNRILLLEPSHFKQYPVSKNSIDFMLKLAGNIDAIQIYVGEFHELIEDFNLKKMMFKAHPLSSHYQGEEEKRELMFSVQGYFPSFFSYWKECKKELLPIEIVS